MGLAAKRELVQGVDAQRSLLRAIAEVRPLALMAAETPALRWKQERWGFSPGFTP